MLVNIKPHSSLSKFFRTTDIAVELDSFFDVINYLTAMQPAFINYVRQQKQNDIEEGYVLLDSNLNELTYEQMLIKRVRDGDTIHIVPAIIGGGGKRGGLLAVVGLFAAIAFGPAILLAMGSTGAAVGAGTVATGAVTQAAGTGLLSGAFLKNLVVNIGLALLSSLFNKRPDTTDKASRNNDMFGSLKNTTSSDTPVALHYGNVRAAGQMVSGYIKTVNHSRNSTIRVDEVMQT